MTKVTILGCGGSGGVPRIGNDWGACDPNNEKNRRTRASIFVETETTSILVDTSPDCRIQLINNNMSNFDAILYTHAHADHSHGIDDVRTLFRAHAEAYPVYASDETLAALKTRFAYAFESHSEWYRPFYQARPIDGPFRVGDIDVVPFGQDHGDITSTGFRFGDIAYSTDLVGLGDAAYEALDGVRIWIVQALQDKPHPLHAHTDMALEWIERVSPERAILTHMGVFQDFDRLAARTPEEVEPAYDGMIIEV
jgi:phosphoribosyl 1,2-cyclic phosphate phosphodiesterase